MAVSTGQRSLFRNAWAAIYPPETVAALEVTHDSMSSDPEVCMLVHPGVQACILLGHCSLSHVLLGPGIWLNISDGPDRAFNVRLDSRVAERHCVQWHQVVHIPVRSRSQSFYSRGTDLL